MTFGQPLNLSELSFPYLTSRENGWLSAWGRVKDWQSTAPSRGSEPLPTPCLCSVTSHHTSISPRRGGIFLNLGGAFAFNISSTGIWYLSAEIDITGTEKGRACRDGCASQARCELGISLCPQSYRPSRGNSCLVLSLGWDTELQERPLTQDVAA